MATSWTSRGLPSLPRGMVAPSSSRCFAWLSDRSATFTTPSTFAVEPAESAVLSGGQPGPHKIEGVGIGYTPPLWEPSLVDEVVPIKTEDAKEMARRLAREEGLFAGTSSGANVLAAIEVGKRLGPDATVVTLLVDSGLKYLNTDVYRRD